MVNNLQGLFIIIVMINCILLSVVAQFDNANSDINIPLQPSFDEDGRAIYRINSGATPFFIPKMNFHFGNQQQQQFSPPFMAGSNVPQYPPTIYRSQQTIQMNKPSCRSQQWYGPCNLNPQPQNYRTPYNSYSLPSYYPPQFMQSQETQPIRQQSHGYLQPQQVRRLYETSTENSDISSSTDDNFDNNDSDDNMNEAHQASQSQTFSSSYYKSPQNMLAKSEAEIIRGNCANGIDCQSQKPQDIICKDTLMKSITAYQNVVKGRNCSEDVKRQFNLIYQYKLTLMERAGIHNSVIPADNGVVDGDIILTAEQAQYLIDELNTTNTENKTRRKRSGMFFNDANNFAKKWDTRKPIPYRYATDINENEKRDIQAGIRMIENAVPCIKFRYDANVKDYFIYFMKLEAANTCGLTHTGRILHGTQVMLGFRMCDDMPGVIAHEILHALGVSHMHTRLDRDQYIKILWELIDPQKYDEFAIADPKIYSTYGVPYDYESIMHYRANLAPKSFLKSTMVPLKDRKKNEFLMGQRKRLSKSDIELLKKMYCDHHCEDKKVYCGIWASKGGFCTKKNYRRFMHKNCRKSCNFCHKKRRARRNRKSRSNFHKLL